MLTAGQIINRAALIAKAPNYTNAGSAFGNIALDLLNSILSDLCLQYDFASARSLYAFNFNPGLTSNFGSGPYPLPVDYLRASGSSGEGQKAFFWTLQGVPYPMVPCDVSEFDMQVQQAGLQSYPWLWSTDLAFGDASRNYSNRWRATGILSGNAQSASATLQLAAASIGQGVPPSYGIAGDDVVPGTTILASTPTATPGQFTLTLSQRLIATISTASVLVGEMANGYAYPPPSGAYPVTIRYQRMMPPLVDTTRFCWFPEDGYLIEALAGRMMEITDDQRTIEFLGDGQRPGRAQRMLRTFMGNMDDKRNRPQQVELDRRRFGPSMRTLRNTKQVGW